MLRVTPYAKTLQIQITHSPNNKYAIVFQLCPDNKAVVLNPSQYTSPPYDKHNPTTCNTITSNYEKHDGGDKFVSGAIDLRR